MICWKVLEKYIEWRVSKVSLKDAQLLVSKREALQDCIMLFILRERDMD